MNNISQIIQSSYTPQTIQDICIFISASPLFRFDSHCFVIPSELPSLPTFVSRTPPVTRLQNQDYSLNDGRFFPRERDFALD